MLNNNFKVPYNQFLCLETFNLDNLHKCVLNFIITSFLKCWVIPCIFEFPAGDIQIDISHKYIITFEVVLFQNNFKC